MAHGILYDLADLSMTVNSNMNVYSTAMVVVVTMVVVKPNVAWVIINLLFNSSFFIKLTVQTHRILLYVANLRCALVLLSYQQRTI